MHGLGRWVLGECVRVFVSGWSVSMLYVGVWSVGW